MMGLKTGIGRKGWFRLMVMGLTILAIFVWVYVGVLNQREAEHTQPVTSGMHAEGEAPHSEGQEEGIALSEEARRNIGLMVEPVGYRTIQKIIPVSGIVKPKPGLLAQVSPRIEGIVEKMYVSPFDWVKAGQILAEIRSRQFGNPPPLVPLAAPISGLITRWDANVGEAADPSKVLFQIVDPSVLWVEGDVPEQYAAQVKPGQPVRVSMVALPGEVFTGQIIRMSGMVEPEKRTVHVWVEVANPKYQLKPEMFAELAVVVGNSSKVLTVPLKAILKSGGETFVFVESGERYLRRNVVVGLSDDRYAEIKEGLSKRDRVVTQGNYELMSSIFIKGGAEEHAH